MNHILQILGGMAMFLFGVGMLGQGMEKLAGDRIQLWLDRMTSRPIKGAIFGMVATALTQSSSLLMVTMIGLVNANLMTLVQAVGVMMGQEIGTTLTAQIVALRVGDLCFLFIAGGFVLIEFGKQDQWRKYGEVILGAGLLFLGMNLMSGALTRVATAPQVSEWLAVMGQNRFAGILAGTVATAVVQSSSAITGLLVAMGISDAITLPGAISILLGANIGTCVTGFIASSRLSRAARRASVAQILINVLGVLLFLPILSPFTALVSRTSDVLPRQIANAHTIFNVAVSVILFPFVRQITEATQWLVPESTSAEEPSLTAYIDERLFGIPQVAIQEAYREFQRLANVTAEMVDRSCRALLELDMDAAQWVLNQEEAFVDPVCELLDRYINGLLQNNLSPEEQRRCFQIKNLLIDVERVGDLAENLAQNAQERHEHDIIFSQPGMEELGRLFQHAHRTYLCALEALDTRDRLLAEQACLLESEFDKLYLKARETHIARMEQGVCAAEADVIYMESLRHLERIGDHADNIGVSVSEN